jgi:agmatinase
MRRASEMAWVRRIIHVGQRGVGSARPADVHDSLEAGNSIVTAGELAQLGVASVADRLDPGERFVVVYDVDGTDPAHVPAVRAPVAGGLRVDQIGELIAALAARGAIDGLVVTEFEPDLDSSGTSALVLARVVCRALEARLGGQD